MADYVYDGQESVLVVGSEAHASIHDYTSIYSAGEVTLIFTTSAETIRESAADPRCQIAIVLEDTGFDFASLITDATAQPFYALIAGDAVIDAAIGGSTILSSIGSDLTAAHERLVLVAQNLQNLRNQRSL